MYMQFTLKSQYVGSMHYMLLWMYMYLCTHMEAYACTMYAGTCIYACYFCNCKFSRIYSYKLTTR